MSLSPERADRLKRCFIDGATAAAAASAARCAMGTVFRYFAHFRLAGVARGKVPRTGQPLTAAQIHQLEDCFKAGATIREAAAVAGVSHVTVVKHFAIFRAAGIPRISIPRAGSKHGWDWHRNRYTGPAMIGVAITAAPQPVGPDWIGTR